MFVALHEVGSEVPLGIVQLETSPRMRLRQMDVNERARGKNNPTGKQIFKITCLNAS